jgi:hypothetical protein
MLILHRDNWNDRTRNHWYNHVHILKIINQARNDVVKTPTFPKASTRVEYVTLPVPLGSAACCTAARSSSSINLDALSANPRSRSKSSYVWLITLHNWSRSMFPSFPWRRTRDSCLLRRECISYLASEIVVIVIVWLCNSVEPPTVRGQISP